MLTIEELRQMTAKQRQEYFTGELYKALKLSHDEISQIKEDAHIRLIYIDGFNAIDGVSGIINGTYIDMLFDYREDVLTYFPLLPKKERYGVYNDDAGLADNDYHYCKRTIKQSIRNARGIMRIEQLEAELASCRANNLRLEAKIACLEAENAELRLSLNPGPEYLAAKARFESLRQ